MVAGSVEVTGLEPLVRQLKGPLFKDTNRELRQYSRLIAGDLVPVIAAAVAQSPAPQAAAMAGTVRVHSDRVPVVVVGKTNPRLSNFTKGGNTRRRRGAIAHGVVYGPAGKVNYYRIPRDPSGGALGRALEESGPVFDRAAELYLRYFLRTMQTHGFLPAGDGVTWGG
jgi:hypothetical protein